MLAVKDDAQHQCLIRPDPAPRGAYRGCAPPSEDCAPKKFPGSGLLECKSRPKLASATGIFVNFVDWNRISWHFWDEDLFFFEITCFRPEKPRKFPISAGKSLTISVKTFVFFGDHLFSAGKTAWIPDFGRKTPLILWSSPCSFDPDWDFSCLSRIHVNKLLVPPKIYFCPPPPRPSHAVLNPAHIQLAQIGPNTCQRSRTSVRFSV